MRSAIPELPMCVAVTLCVINCILPGIGTIIAVFTFFCCGNPAQSGGGKFYINLWVGLAQVYNAGRGHSVSFWGIAIIVISDEGRKKREGVASGTTATPWYLSSH